jgi:hypothetical protein
VILIRNQGVGKSSFKKKGRGQKKRSIKKTLVVGLKHISIKKCVEMRSTRHKASLLQSHVFKRRFPPAFSQGETLKAICLLPSAFCLLPSAFCLLPSEFHHPPWRVEDAFLTTKAFKIINHLSISNSA